MKTPKTLSKRERDLFTMLRRLTHVAAAINGLQHAGNPIPPEGWSDLYRLTNEAKALLDQVRGSENYAN